MDIFRIGRPQAASVATTKKTDAQKSADRDPQQNSGDQGSQKDKPASEGEAKDAAAKLARSEHFLANALTVEVREFDGKFFLDVFDPKNRKIKTIGAGGIRAIVSSYSSAGQRESRILDRRV